MTSTGAIVTAVREEGSSVAAAGNHIDWLIDNAETYSRLLESLRSARRSVRIAQLAFDADCAAYAGGSLAGSPSDDVAIAELLIDLARNRGAEIKILLNATWILNTARQLRKFFAERGVPEEQIEVRGLSRFPHFMHAKLVLIDEREAFLLGSPFVNSYWDDGAHIPFDARRPSRELGGRPLHDVSAHLRGAAVRDLESLFASVWDAAAPAQSAISRATRAANASASGARQTGVRVVADAPDGILPSRPDGTMQMLGELLAVIARARSFIYIEQQYLTSRIIVAALVDALYRNAALEIIIVLNQNPDLTAYRGWQNAQLREHTLLSHPRVGVFSLWSTGAHPEHAGVTRINQLFIHSKVIVVDDEWAAVGSSNLDGVSLGDYGADFASALGRSVFRGVRNVEVNLVIDAGTGMQSDSLLTDPIVTLRERLWREHLGWPRDSLTVRAHEGWLATWRDVARANARRLGSPARIDTTGAMVGRLLPYSPRAYPREQLADAGITLDPARLALCYNPGWFGVFASPHWIRNIF
ncbi:MAG: phosphatidylserine/phosphatidylglycerophosphate/cardiolipin synthase family protein [Gemmatimonadaceae bacterium]|nr:phosphatidylserine/phosphatidylglycerophosphate/cardiolipin synthase family protein [Gemmatimonadaceae bacterium]